MRKEYVLRLLEFFIVGVLMGVFEDLIAIHYATNAVITSDVIIVAAIVALPFAVFSELIVDWKHMKFIQKRMNNLKNDVRNTTKLLTK